MRVGPWRRLSAKELMLLNCGAIESPLDNKEVKPVNPKGNQCWMFIGKTDADSWSSNVLATWCKETTHWKRSWCWERLKAEGEGGDRGWVGWMASLIQWTWVWANSGRWWRTGKPGVLQSVHRFAKSWTRFSVRITTTVDVSLLLPALLGCFSDVALHTNAFLCPKHSSQPLVLWAILFQPPLPQRTSPGNPSFISSDSYTPCIFPLEALPIYILSV